MVHVYELFAHAYNNRNILTPEFTLTSLSYIMVGKSKKIGTYCKMIVTVDV